MSKKRKEPRDSSSQVPSSGSAAVPAGGQVPVANASSPTGAGAPGAGPASTAATAATEAAAGARHFASRAFRAAKWLLTEYDLLGGSAPRKPAEEAGTGGQESDGESPTLVGHASVIAVPEVLGLLATLHKSGTVEVWNGQTAYRIQLLRGAVVSAQTTSNDPDLRIGNILVEDGAIEKAALDAFVAELLPRGKRLGDGLVDAGLIDREALVRAIARQAQKVFHAAYDLPDAWYRFDPLPEAAEVERGMSMTQLLLESARRRDEVRKSPPG